MCYHQKILDSTMNRFLKSIIIALCIFIAGDKALAQIEAPYFQCISGDSLFFQQVDPTCGPATGMVIYISADIDGPYQVLDSVMDLSASNYVHDTTGTFYYFLQTTADCPMEIPLNSDTLSNETIQPIEILSVSTEGNGLRLVWSQSNAPNVLDYIIFRSSPSGAVSIDTIPDTTYLDLTADVNMIQNYLVLTRDVCGKTSIFPEAHNNIVLDTLINPCSNALEYVINPYLPWLDDGYTIFTYADNLSDPDPAQLIDSFSTNERILTDDLLNGQAYCSYVVLENDITGRRVRSSDICFVPAYNQLVKFLQITALSFTPGQSSEIEVKWTWNSNASVEDASIYTSNDSFPIQTSPSLVERNNQFINIQAGDSVIIWTIDSCGNIFTSSAALSATLNPNIDRNNQITIDHTGPGLPSNIVFSSASLLLFDAAGNLRTVSNNLAFTETLNIAGNTLEEDELCFLVEYSYRDTATNITYTNYGPTQCIQRFPSLFFPNAFSPNGVNFEFRPRTTRRSIEGYQLQVYDRYGQKIFETDELLEGWDGLNENGRPLMRGVYLYRVRIKNDAYDWEDSGTVYLLK